MVESRGTVDVGQTAADDGPPQLNVLVVYEDLGTGLRARHTFDQAVGQLGLQADFHVNLWRFDLLREPALLERAADQAAQADIVFLSAHGPGGLPAAVTSWLKYWLARKGSGPRALAVSLDIGARDTAATKLMVETLRAATLPAGVDEFLHFGEAPLKEWDLTIEGIQRRAEAPTTLLDEVPYRFEPKPYRHWGLNE